LVQNLLTLSNQEVIMFSLEKTLLLARAAFFHGYILEAKVLYSKLLKLQPNHAIAKKELRLINTI